MRLMTLILILMAGTAVADEWRSSGKSLRGYVDSGWEIVGFSVNTDSNGISTEETMRILLCKSGTTTTGCARRAGDRSIQVAFCTKRLPAGKMRCFELK